MAPVTEFIPLDIETGSADDVYRLPAGSRDYVKLLGVGRDAYTSWRVPPTDRTHYATVNGNFFDFPVLDRHVGIPVEQTIPFSRDLRLAAFQNDPPTSYQTSRGPGYKRYSMDALAERYLGDTRKSDLGKELAREYGGWDLIPVDEPRFHEYLRADLDVTRRLNEAIPFDPYEEREAWVSTVTARTTLNGFRVDVDGLTKRVEQLGERLDAGKALLASYGFPLTNKAGRPAAAPQRTRAGKEAFTVALREAGFPVDAWPLGKDGTLSLSKETMAHALEHAQAHVPGAVTVIEAVSDLNGVRNSAQNLLNNTHHGRVHYSFEPFQATGRWSCGLTVLKKGVADSERQYLLPEGGHVVVTIDLDQIDIRAVAAHSQDLALIALLNDPDRDIHTEIAEMSGVPRKQAKTLDLGWLYGRSANAMAQMPGMDRESAQRVCSYMSHAFPGVVAYQARMRERGESGALLDNGFGRRLRVDQERAYTQSVAMIGQSTTREFIAEGLLDLARRAPEMLPMLRVLVHDEVVASVPEKDAEECARILQDCLSRPWAPPGGSNPVNVSAGQGKPFTFGKHWNELYV
jgi:DNA polymerase I